MVQIVCGIIGAIAALVVVVNHLSNWTRRRKEARIRAETDLVDAVCTTFRDERGYIACELYVINNDTRPVTKATVAFFSDAREENPPYQRLPGTLTRGEKFHIKQFGIKGSGYKHAHFFYIDAENNTHDYRRDVVLQPL